MTKKRVAKLIAIIIAFIMLPLTSFNLSVAKADTPDYTANALAGTEFVINIDNEIKNASNGIVKVVVSDGNLFNAETVYQNGADTNEGDSLAVSYTAGSNTSPSKLKVTAYVPGTYNFTISATVSEVDYTYTAQITVGSDVTVFGAPTYNLDTAVLSEYQAKVLDSTYIEGSEPKKNLRVNDSYKVPSMEKLINSTLISYEKYRKIVYYSTPGSSSYVSASFSGTSQMSFNITRLGEYKFYVALDADLVDGKDFDLNTNNTEELEDGFYAVYDENDNRLFVDTTNQKVKYYVDEDKTTEYTDLDKIERELVVPTFKFSIVNNAGPSVKITSSYQEKGYIGLTYTVKSITVGGSDINATYTLQYNANSSDEEDEGWATATEEYDSATGKFTPENEGYYRVVVSVVDGDGLTASGKTKVITVTEKYQNVEYKTSFGDWLEVNTLPFIFLCISGACLIAIVLLLVIKPKEKTETVADDGEDL